MTNNHAPLPKVPPQVAALAAAPSSTSVDLVAQAGRIMIARQVKEVYRYHNDVLAGKGSRAVHQMRVATRRMRATIAATEEVWAAKRLERLRKPLKRLAATLGSARDADVLLQHLQAYKPRGGVQDEHEFVAFVATIKADRAAAQAALRDLLMSKRYAKLLDELVDFLGVPLNEVGSDDAELPILVRHRAGSAIWRQYEAVRIFETILPTATAEQLHTLRIAAKHLRYTLELFESALGTRGGRLLNPLRALQEQLGNIHDADVAVAAANLYLHRQGTIPAVLQYIKSREAERARAVQALPMVWSTLTGPAYRGTAGRALASL